MTGLEIMKPMKSLSLSSFRLFSSTSSSMNFKSEKLTNYFNLKAFYIVGASDDRSKFGNKVLRCMVAHNKKCVPLSKRISSIEGMHV